MKNSDKVTVVHTEHSVHVKLSDIPISNEVPSSKTGQNHFFLLVKLLDKYLMSLLCLDVGCPSNLVCSYTWSIASL